MGSSDLVVAPIPGKNTVGIEVPNNEQQLVRLREVIEDSAEKAEKMKIPIFLGKDVSGAGTSPTGDGWACKDFDWQVNHLRRQRSRHWAALHLQTTWSSRTLSDDTGQPIPLVEERTTIRVWPATAD